MHYFRIHQLASIALVLLLSVSLAVDPCEEFTASVHGASTKFDAKLFRKCIQNVPFIAEKAEETLRNIRKFFSVNAQSHYHLHPPNNELELNVFSINQTLDAIAQKISDNKYPNNWSFDYDVVRAFNMFRDGHTQYEPTCINGYYYAHDFPLASIASDINGLPKIVHVIHDSQEKQWKPPIIGDTVVKINGEPAADWLEDFVKTTPESLIYIDPDARMNQALYGFPEGIFPGRFVERNLWNGEELKLTWENGTETTVNWEVLMTATMVKNGGQLAFHDTKTLTELCFLSQTELEKAAKGEHKIRKRYVYERIHRRQDPGESVAKYGYPAALAHIPEYALAIYPLASDSKTVVLTIHTFSPHKVEVPEFIKSVQKFLQEQVLSWKRAGIKRLIIDVSNNNGGLAILPCVILKVLFPENNDFPGINMRYSPVVWAYMYAQIDGEIDDLYFDQKLKNFANMSDFLGPVEKDGSYFTNLWKQDYIEFGKTFYNTTIVSSGTQAFDPKDIAILSNSLCASACHSLTEALHSLGVRSFVYGGRPSKKTLMQASGGTKGGKVIDYDTLRTVVNGAGDKSKLKEVMGADDTWKLNPISVRTMGLSMNSENKFRDGEGGDELPLEFVYTPACRRFSLTESMLKDITTMWEEVRNLAWNNEGHPMQCSVHPKTTLKQFRRDLLETPQQIEKGVSQHDTSPRIGKSVFQHHQEETSPRIGKSVFKHPQEDAEYPQHDTHSHQDPPHQEPQHQKPHHQEPHHQKPHHQKPHHPESQYQDINIHPDPPHQVPPHPAPLHHDTNPHQEPPHHQPPPKAVPHQDTNPHHIPSPHQEPPSPVSIDQDLPHHDADPHQAHQDINPQKDTKTQHKSLHQTSSHQEPPHPAPSHHDPPHYDPNDQREPLHQKSTHQAPQHQASSHQEPPQWQPPHQNPHHTPPTHHDYPHYNPYPQGEPPHQEPPHQAPSHQEPTHHGPPHQEPPQREPALPPQQPTHSLPIHHDSPHYDPNPQQEPSHREPHLAPSHQEPPHPNPNPYTLYHDTNPHKDAPKPKIITIDQDVPLPQGTTLHHDPNLRPEAPSYDKNHHNDKSYRIGKGVYKHPNEETSPRIGKSVFQHAHENTSPRIGKSVFQHPHEDATPRVGKGAFKHPNTRVGHPLFQHPAGSRNVDPADK